MCAVVIIITEQKPMEQNLICFPWLCLSLNPATAALFEALWQPKFFHLFPHIFLFFFPTWNISKRQREVLLEGQTKSEFLIGLWVVSSKAGAVLSDVASAKADIALQTPGVQLARADKSWDVEQQGGLADNELCPRILHSLGQQEFKNPGKWVGISAVAGLITQGNLPTWCLTSCSVAIAWPGTGEKKTWFLLSENTEKFFSFREAGCVWIGKKYKGFLCVFFPVTLLYLYIKRENYKQIFFLCLSSFGEKLAKKCLSGQCPPVPQILFISIFRALHRWNWGLGLPETGCLWSLEMATLHGSGNFTKGWIMAQEWFFLMQLKKKILGVFHF